VTYTDRDTDVTLCERPATLRDGASTSAVDKAVDGQHTAVRDRLSDYLEGSLPPADVAGIRDHLDVCSPCRAFWSTFRRTVEATRLLPTHRLSNDAKRHLLEQVARVEGRT